MVTITIDIALAEELLDARIKTLNDALFNILEERGYNDAGKFLSECQFKEGEDVDADKVRKWLDRITFIESLRSSWKEIAIEEVNKSPFDAGYLNSEGKHEDSDDDIDFYNEFDEDIDFFDDNDEFTTFENEEE